MRSSEATQASTLAVGVNGRTVALAAGAVAFAAATAAAAYVRVPLPFSPVPVTAQTLVVLLAGATLGPGWGALSQVLYLALASAGLPVLAGPSLLGPTGGYLVGFMLAAIVVGWVARRRASQRRDDLPTMAAAMLAGTVLIYLCGATWLAFVAHLSAAQAVTLGVIPFLAGDLLKLAAALGIWRLASRTGKVLAGARE